MIYAIVGHRGVGKTSFLQRLKNYFDVRMQPCHVLDLDSEIEQRTGQTIPEIFKNNGEPYFRNLERTIFAQVLEEVSNNSGIKFIALGAGFDGAIPGGVRVLWLRRPTDRAGRIFVDRPRLDGDIAPLKEFMNRYDARDERFRKIYHKEIMLSEGWDFVNDFEPYLLGLKPASMGGCVTVLPEYVQNPRRLDLFIEEFSVLGVQYFELRDDLLPDDVIAHVASKIPAEKVLISFRKPERSSNLVELSKMYAVDWASELGESPFDKTAILSLHVRKPDESVDEAAERLLSNKAEHYKLALPVEDFVELWSGHRFFTEDPERRSFLPMSRHGRWQWYRAFHGRKMKVNFVRRGEGSSPDQPLLFDYLRMPKRAIGFAAVLGDPVGHSRTPAEHSEFFREREVATVAIQMNEYECNSLNMSVLQRLGLVAAAVTSPLKKKIMDVCTYIDKKALDLSAVNTIIQTPSGWNGTNTDVNGVEAMFAAIEMPEEVAVWGGGGTRLVLKKVLPHAHFFSARRGEEIWVEKQTPMQPEVVVWALGRSRVDTSQMPPVEWRPKYVMDLNYSEDSPGLEYALEVGAKYISGKSLFRAQARMQREYWTR
ncbi:MAG: shikimate synthase [Bdellovibrionales bacterium]|nr:shikimate synthase [Bdellovibrionales bacterium]